MVYLPNIPQQTDQLDVSQPEILGNFQQLDTSFGIDHYKYSDLTADNGKHNQVTTPEIVGGVHPTTAADEPKFYAMQDSANLGVIQYSRGPSNAVPTPLTRLQVATGGVLIGAASTTNVFDFTGLNNALCVLYAAQLNSSSNRVVGFVRYDGVAVRSSNMTDQAAIPASKLNISPSGAILRLANSDALGMTVYWSLEFLRIE